MPCDISKATEFVNENLPEYQETEREQEGKKLQMIQACRCPVHTRLCIKAYTNNINQINLLYTRLRFNLGDKEQYRVNGYKW